jgi:hypothetical protein
MVETKSSNSSDNRFGNDVGAIVHSSNAHFKNSSVNLDGVNQSLMNKGRNARLFRHECMEGNESDEFEVHRLRSRWYHRGLQG